MSAILTVLASRRWGHPLLQAAGYVSLEGNPPAPTCSQPSASHAARAGQDFRAARSGPVSGRRLPKLRPVAIPTSQAFRITERLDRFSFVSQGIASTKPSGRTGSQPSASHAARAEPSAALPVRTDRSPGGASPATHGRSPISFVSQGTASTRPFGRTRSQGGAEAPRPIFPLRRTPSTGTDVDGSTAGSRVAVLGLPGENLQSRRLLL